MMKSPTLLFILALLFLMNVINAQSFKSEKVQYNNQDLREISETYFDNPNYWEAILKASNFKTVSEIKPGDLLTIPTGLINSTIERTDETLTAIRSATENGAKVFTPDLLARAQEKLNRSTTFRHSNNWNEAYQSINEALKDAKQALEQSQLLRKQSADATISFRKGDVQNRTPSQRLWKEATLYSKLYEEDRTRTLRDSYAEITFIDLSRVRLNENSQALIQRSKLDLLKNTTETKVKLIKGDAFAYLQKSPKKKFDLDIPGLDSRINSKSFWVEKEDRSSKIANYEGEIELQAAGKTVLVKENQGSVIPTGGAPSDPKDLLPSPQLMAPESNTKFYTGTVNFEWKFVDDARNYLFEIAEDQAFKELVYSTKFLTNNKTRMNSLSPGIYYWHVASIDEFGFPGKFSDNRYIHVIKDENKPYLYITSPGHQLITTELVTTVAGETERSSTIKINETEIPIDENGFFSEEINLIEGFNKVQVVAIDKAGNISEYISNVICETNDNVEVDFTSEYFDQNTRTLIANASKTSISGKTRPLSLLEITPLKGNNKYRAYADTSGLFQYTLYFNNDEDEIVQKIISPAGFEKIDTISIVVDKIAPTINLTSKIPKFTSDPNLEIIGTTSEESEVTINNKLFTAKFEQKINLSEGNNDIIFRAIDKAGNISTLEHSVILDVTPPELIKHSIKKVSGKQSLYRVSISAKDKSGIKKAIKVEVGNDFMTTKEILKLNDTTGNYEGDVLFRVNGSPKIKSVTLEDYLNNSKTYFIK